MTDDKFFIASMPASRPADYHLGYMEGSVFLDFNKLNNGQIYLQRISFDGYGCCELKPHVKPLSEKDSLKFAKIFEDNLEDHYTLASLVKKTILANDNLIWPDALKEYRLI